MSAKPARLGDRLPHRAACMHDQSAPFPKHQQPQRVVEVGAGQQDAGDAGPARFPGRSGAGNDSICTRMSGEALTRNQRRPSPLTATHDWVRGDAPDRTGADAPAVAAAAVPLGNPPPAAVPSKRTRMCTRSGLVVDHAPRCSLRRYVIRYATPAYAVHSQFTRISSKSGLIHSCIGASKGKTRGAGNRTTRPNDRQAPTERKGEFS